MRGNEEGGAVAVHLSLSECLRKRGTVGCRVARRGGAGNAGEDGVAESETKLLGGG
jgi:hypothetical protein